MVSSVFPIFILTTAFVLVASEANEDTISPHVDLKRIPKKADDIDASSSIIREQHVLPGNLLDISEEQDFDLPKKPASLRSGLRFSSRGNSYGKVESAKDSRVTPGKQRGYGYPFLIAPTLPPNFRPGPDAFEDPNSKLADSRKSIPPIPRMPSMPEMPKLPKSSGSYLKKRKDSHYDDEHSESNFSPSISRRYSIYKEPSYRNFFDLEALPQNYDGRRIDYEPYSSPPTYHNLPSSKRAPTSPRDPYLSPSDEPTDGFYPKVYKNNGVSTSHSSYGKKDEYYDRSYDSPPSSGKGYSESSRDGYPPSSHDDDFRLGHGGYVKSHNYNGNSASYSGSSPHGPSDSGNYGSGYSSLRDSPIIGETRKRLLDYTGATDIYEGEPDYLKDAARKPKFGRIQDDYYPYGRTDPFSHSDYHFDENRPRPSRIKRRSVNEDTTPECAKNSTIPLCLADADYPEVEVKNAVAKNIQYILQLSGATIEVTESKKRAPESLKELEKSRDLCSSSRGDVYPLRSKDVTGIWRVIVNVFGVQQSVLMDVCRVPDSTCDFLPRTITSRCNQKHSAVPLLTFDPEGHRLELHDFPIPTSCSCSIGRPIRIRPE